MKEVWQERNVEAVNRLHAPDFTDRSSAGRTPDNEGFTRGLLELFHAFPDFLAKTEDIVVDDTNGKIALRWTAVGTHHGNFMGVPPTGKRITFRGIEILRIKDGRIVERWGEWDGFNLMEQLGLKAATGSNPRE